VFDGGIRWSTCLHINRDNPAGLFRFSSGIRTVVITAARGRQTAFFQAADLASHSRARTLARVIAISRRTGVFASVRTQFEVTIAQNRADGPSLGRFAPSARGRGISVIELGALLPRSWG